MEFELALKQRRDLSEEEEMPFPPWGRGEHV